MISGFVKSSYLTVEKKTEPSLMRGRGVTGAAVVPFMTFCGLLICCWKRGPIVEFLIACKSPSMAADICVCVIDELSYFCREPSNIETELFSGSSSVQMYIPGFIVIPSMTVAAFRAEALLPLLFLLVPDMQLCLVWASPPSFCWMSFSVRDTHMEFSSLLAKREKAWSLLFCSPF